MDDNISLELPPELAPVIDISVKTSLGIGEIIIAQSPMEFIDGKWRCEIVLMEPGEHLRTAG